MSSEPVITKKQFIKDGINAWASELNDCGLDLNETSGNRIINKKCNFQTALHYTQVNNFY